MSSFEYYQSKKYNIIANQLTLANYETPKPQRINRLSPADVPIGYGFSSEMERKLNNLLTGIGSWMTKQNLHCALNCSLF